MEGLTCIRVTGELDLASAAGFNRRLWPLLRRGGDLELDLSELEFMDSAGARALFVTISDARRGGHSCQLRPTPSRQVHRFLKMLCAEGWWARAGLAGAA